MLLLQRLQLQEENISSYIESVVSIPDVKTDYSFQEINTFINMFHAPMAKFELELIHYFTYFFSVVRSNICVFLSCRPFVVNTIFSTVLVGVGVTSVSWLEQLTV